MSIYNNDRKQIYINYLFSNSQHKDIKELERTVINFFNRLGTVEQDFDIDIADADYETALNMISLLSNGSNRYINRMISKIRVYIDWCIQEGLTLNNENKLDGVRAEEIDKSLIYKITMVKDEQQLLEYLDVVFDNIKEDTFDIIHRTYTLLLFAGVDPQQTEDLLLTAYDQSKKTIMSNGKEIVLSSAAAEHLDSLIEIKYFTSKSRESGQISTRRKTSTGHLIETALSSRKHITHYFKSALSKALQRYKEITKSPKLLTTSTIFKSGVFYRAYIHECETNEIRLNEMWSNKPEPINDEQMFERTRFNKSLINEYENWKKAFNLMV